MGLIFVLEVGIWACNNLDKLGGGMWMWGANQLSIVGILYLKANSTTFYLRCDHFRDMTQLMLTSNLVFIHKRPINNFLNSDFNDFKSFGHDSQS
jgi:hypothetical protein